MLSTSQPDTGNILMQRRIKRGDKIMGEILREVHILTSLINNYRVARENTAANKTLAPCSACSGSILSASL